MLEPAAHGPAANSQHIYVHIFNKIRAKAEERRTFRLIFICTIHNEKLFTSLYVGT
jgi:hypothetical protein